MYTIHFICNNKIIMQRTISELPRLNDVVRTCPNKFYKVVDLVWCMDEEVQGLPKHVRVNIGLEVLQDE